MINYGLKDNFSKKLEVLYRIVLEIATKKNLSAASENLLNYLLDSLESVSGSIHLYSEDKLFLLANRGKGCVNDDILLSAEEEKRLISSDMPVEIKDIFLYPNVYKAVENSRFSFNLLMPMVSGEYLVGSVFIGNKGNMRGYTNEEKILFAMICKQIAIVVHNSYLERELLKANNLRSDLYIRSITDPLTGLYHRAHLEYRLKEDLKVSKRYDRPFSALMIEIDYFFQISEMNGSQLTYHLLQGVAKTIEKAIRLDVDLPARYSVDTIVVLLPETGAEGAMVLAERIRQKINSLHRVINIENFPQISASIGVATLEDREEKPEELIDKLREALGQAKAAGSNKVFLCKKATDKREKLFSTFETSSGMESNLTLNNIGNSIAEDDGTQNITSGTAYRAVEFYQKNVSVDWNPDTNSAEIKMKSSRADDFSYQPMMFLDFIKEEEKEQLKKQEEEKAKMLSSYQNMNSPSVNTLNPIRKTPMNINRLDNINVKKSQMRHGKIPNMSVNRNIDKQDKQIHSLGFVDDT